EVHQEAVSARELPVDLAGQQVLLAEPEKADAFDLCSQLERLGCAVTMISGTADLASLVRPRLDAQHPFCILNILVTNESLLRQVAELRALAPPSKLSIVVCTTVGVSGDGKSFGEAGAQGYLSGNLSDDQLRDAMQDVLSHRGNGSCRLVTRF